MSALVATESLQARADRWIAAELARLQRHHGPAWPSVAEWVEAYVREEAAQRVAKLEAAEA